MGGIRVPDNYVLVDEWKEEVHLGCLSPRTKTDDGRIKIGFAFVKPTFDVVLTRNIVFLHLFNVSHE